MRRDINCSEVDIAVSHGDLAFQPVIDDFEHSERILIVTYNVSSRNNKLLDAVGNSGASATIISNIPSRFPRYFGPNAEQLKNSARRQIETYLKRLDPTRFDAEVEVYFNFENHAKIIMTENIAFVGSANFSDESGANWECGVITSNEVTLVNLESVIEEIKRDSIQYLGEPTTKLFAHYAKLQGWLELLEDKVSEEDLDELGFWLGELEDAIEMIDRKWWASRQLGGPLTSFVDLDGIERLNTLIAESDALRDYASFDPEYVDAEELPIDAYDENLDRYLEAALSDKAYQLAEHEAKAHDDIKTLRQDLTMLCSQLRTVLAAVSKSKSAIDNTQSEGS